jgi:hypothetical protein
VSREVSAHGRLVPLCAFHRSLSRRAYFCDVLVLVVLLSVLPVPFFLTFFLCTFFVVEVVEVSVEDWLEFWAFLAAGAAIRNGTATAVNRVLVTSFFIVVSP